MKLTRSLLCLSFSVLAALSFTSCTNSEGGTTTNLEIGNRPIYAHRIGFVDPNASDSYGGYGGGFNNGYAFFPMPTERYGDYFNPENDHSLVGNSWERHTTVFTNYSRPETSQQMIPQATPMTYSK
ncbi:MAG TPA: hypothetical protein DDZ88_30190 [Verrucomicrobiales bacterium]|nr:hypothetical protein [Verrucomicrobiales bacterium]